MELHRVPKALAKLPTQARRDPALTGFSFLKFEVRRIEGRINEVIKLYGNLVEEK